MTKHDVVNAFFGEKVRELAGEKLHFNFSPESDDSIAFLPTYSDSVVKQFITGDKELAYGFAFVLVRTYSTDDDDINLEALNFAQAFIDWIDELNRTRTFPDMGEGTEVLEIRNQQNMPNLAMVNAEEGLARYQIQAQIRYRVSG